MSKQVVGREKWVDGVKCIACILVVLGHFFQSMTKAGILSQGHLYEWFNTTIYCFHVSLFFICSGYLYQKNNKFNDVRGWVRNVSKKALGLGVPYVTFTVITWVLKNMFSGNVNDQIGGFWNTLLLHPTAPYWYLYTLFFVFLVTPTFDKTKIAVTGLLVAFAAKLLTMLCKENSIYAVSAVFSNEIWFVLGMNICALNVQLKGKKLLGSICALLFVVLSVVVYVLSAYNVVLSFGLGVLACTAVILLVASYEEMLGKTLGFLTKYTMPIFLMHTLFAAPLRAVLLRIGITNAIVHVVLGLGISFAGPIIAAWIFKKVKWLEFFLYPNKFLKHI